MRDRPSRQGTLKKVLEAEFANKRWVLIEVAVTNPSWIDNKIHDPRPAHPGRFIGPRFEVDFLIPLQVWGFQFSRYAFVLDRLLAGPTDHKRTGRPVNEIWIFARALHGVENDLQVWRDRKPHQRGLRRISAGDRAENAQLESRDKCVQVRFTEHRDVTQVYDESAVNATRACRQGPGGNYPCPTLSPRPCAPPARYQDLYKTPTEEADDR